MTKLAPSAPSSLGFLLVPITAMWVTACSGNSSTATPGDGGSSGAGGAPSASSTSGGALGSGGAAPTSVDGSAGSASSSSSDGNAAGRGSTSGGAVGTGGASPSSTLANTGGTVSSGGRNGSGGASAAGGKAATGGASAAGGKAATGGASAAGGKAATGGASAAGGKAATGGASPTGGKAATGGDAATAGSSGVAKCTKALPNGATPIDVSNATTVVGSGTAASCTFSALNSAVTKGGIIKFDCGPDPVSIAVTATLNPPTTKDTVIDGGGTVTLDGGNKVRILYFNDPDWRVNNVRLTLQHLALKNGKTTPTEQIPSAPAPCSQGWNDGEGGALFMRNGNLTVIDCTFSNNQAAPLGPDTGGGAIYILGSKYGALIVDSVFTENSASNAGAVGGLFAELAIYDSRFENNSAIGNGANSDDASKCSAINNGQHEVGSGGNGGAIYQDGGASTNVILCGDLIINNAAGTGAFGGGVFMTSNDWSGTLSIQDCIITGNTGGSWTQVQEGSVKNVGSAFGVNALSISLSNSTLQGVR